MIKLKDKVIAAYDKRKLMKLEGKVIWLRGEIAKLQDQQENLKMVETAMNSVEEKCHLMIKKKPEKHADKKIGHDKGEESSYTTRSNELRKEDKKPSTIMRSENVKQTKRETLKNGESSLKEVQTTFVMNQKNGNKIIKRCHLCRKRGHLKKNCLVKYNYWNWIKGDSL